MEKENPVTASFPTTFVQADSSSFKQVVQILTGTAQTAAAAASISPAKHQIPPPGKSTAPKKPSFKLYERRNSLKNLKSISPLISAAAANSPRQQTDILSPSTLDFPSLALSPVTPLIPDPFNRSPPPPPPPPPESDVGVTAEERGIAERGFYLHPSPRSDVERPRLLSLFPESSQSFSSSSPLFQ